LFVGFADLIPLVGATLGMVPTVAVAFLHSTTAGIAMIIVFTIYQQFENHVLQVVIMSKTVQINQLVVLVAALAGAQLLGLAGAHYRMVDVDIGKTNVDASRARLEVTCDDDEALANLLEQLSIHGANRVTTADARLESCTIDGVLPAGFYSTTNLPTQVRLDGHWVDVENPEMDCALV